MIENTYRIAEVFAYRDGWDNEDGTLHRSGIETGDLAGAIMLAARRGPNLGWRADLVDFVFVADAKGLWGVGRKVAVSDRGHKGKPHRCFIVDPYDVPADVMMLVGQPRPNPVRSNVQYGVLLDRLFVMDAEQNAAAFL